MFSMCISRNRCITYRWHYTVQICLSAILRYELEIDDWLNIQQGINWRNKVDSLKASVEPKSKQSWDRLSAKKFFPFISIFTSDHALIL